MIAEAVLLDALEAVHSGRLRVHEAYRTIRAAESVTDREGIAQVFHNVLLVGGGSVARVEIEEAIDQVVAFVRPAQQQTIDRADLVTLLLKELRGTAVLAMPLAGRILALLRPVAGVVLAHEEADTILGWIVLLQQSMPDLGFSQNERAMLARLEAGAEDSADGGVSDGVFLIRQEAEAVLRAVVRGGFRTDDTRDQALAKRLEAAA